MGSVFETNLIILFRVFTFKFQQNFFFVASRKEIYEDCSLTSSKSNFEIFDLNLLIILLIQVLLIVIIFLYMIAKKKILFNLQIEEMNLFQRYLIFLACYTYSDLGIQYYKIYQMISDVHN